MKIVLLLSIITLLIHTPAFAATAIRLTCSLRKNVVISKFGYKLSTMKWADQFQVASGEDHTRTKNNTPYVITRFQNGDRFVEFPTQHSFFMIYSHDEVPDRCYEDGTYTYTSTELPRVHS